MDNPQRNSCDNYLYGLFNPNLGPTIVNDETEAKPLIVKPSQKVIPSDDTENNFNNIIDNFADHSAEQLIVQHLNNPGATYPATFIVDSANFPGKRISAQSQDLTNQLYNISIILKKYPEIDILILGHTSEKGQVLSRQRTGRERARSIKNTLKNFDISDDRISTGFKEVSENQINEWGAEIQVHKFDARSNKENAL